LVVAYRFLHHPRKEDGRPRIGKEGIPSNLIAHLFQKERRQPFPLLLRLPRGQGERLA